MNRFARSPATLTLCAIALALAAVVEYVKTSEPPDEALQRCGAVLQRITPGEPELVGLFSLWDLDVWRIPLSLFLHESLLVAIVATALFAFVGTTLEPAWGSRWFVWIWIATSLIGFALAWVVQEAPLGLFTGTCGLIMTDVRKGWGRIGCRRLPPAAITLPTLFVLIAAVGTFLGRWHTPYIAWAAAMSAGWGLGKSWASEEAVPARWSSWFRLSPWVAAVLLFAAIHPVWRGEYFWHEAVRTQDRRAQASLFERAIATDPTLTGPRLALAELLEESGEPQRAWTVLLEAILQDRREPRRQQAAQSLWARLGHGGPRESALQTLRDLFDQEAPAWISRLGLEESRTLGAASLPSSSSDDEADRSGVERFRLDQKIDLPVTLDGEPERDPRPRRLPPPDLHRPDSAAEGRAL